MDTFAAAFRALRARPGFSLLIIALLAVGIGANTAIFGVVHAVLLQPLPYPAPGELVLVRKPLLTGSTLQVPGGGEMMPDNEFLGWLDAEPKSVRSLSGYRNSSVNLQRGDGAVRVTSAIVTGNFFPLLGARAWRGRLFSAEDLKPGASPTTVLSYSAWQSRFGGADDTIGQVVKLDDVAHTIIGILPPAFEFVDPVQFWRPMPLSANAPGGLRIQMIRVFGRLLPGTTPEVAQRELDGISQRYWEGFSPFGGSPPPGAARPRLPFADTSSQLIPLHEQLAGQSRTTLWLLLGAVALVLLIACANVANLQLVRAAAKKRELAVRAALGASPARLALELLTENLLLALAGGALGVLLAWWCTQGLQAWFADFLPRINPVTVNTPVLGFGLALSILAGVGFGLAPAWQGRRIDLLETLKEGGHQHSAGGVRWRQGLVSLEIALALVLAVNTGLLAKSIYQLYSTDLGYRTSDVMTAHLSLPRRYASSAQQRDFAARWQASLQALPGVKITALTDAPPLSGYQQMVIVTTVQGGTGNANASASSQPPSMAVASVTPDYFRAAGIALRQGRFFTDRDAPDLPAVAIVNEAFIKQFYPGGFTMGAEINTPVAPGAPGGHGASPRAAIVGVVADVRPRGFESSPQPLAYFPFAQQPRARVSAVVQFEGPEGPLARSITSATHQIDADLALDLPQTLEQQIARQTAPRRATLILTSAFAVTAVALAALGIFGVMSYTVTQRTQEIGVRMALGADARTILQWMLRQTGFAVGVGLTVGLVLTITTSRLLRSAIAGISASDPAVLAAAAAGLGCIGILAGLIPALRATRVNPVTALRSD